MTIFFRYVILGKTMSWKQACSAAVVVAGIFVALIPNIFSIDQSGDAHASGATGIARVLWPVSAWV